MNGLIGWFRRYFSDPQVVSLALLLLFGVAFVVLMGEILAPVLASVVLAYLLEPLVHRAESGMPRSVAVYLVFVGFLLVLVGSVLGLIPLLSRQFTQLFAQIPVMLSQGQDALMALPQKYPGVFTETQVVNWLDRLEEQLGALGQEVVSRSLASLVDIITIMVYTILMPLMIFFFLKDKALILDWMREFLPRNRSLAVKVWGEVDDQIGNYIRGKFWEILIVWAATYVSFVVLGLQFALLLSLAVGLSVIIPYVGATVVTLPVALVSYYQFGWSADFAWVMGVYLIIQILDGNWLVPTLFSEVVNLHPIAIIIAILFFGGIWGIWGVFFAIPLATLVKAVLNAWPSPAEETPQSMSEA